MFSKNMLTNVRDINMKKISNFIGRVKTWPCQVNRSTMNSQDKRERLTILWDIVDLGFEIDDFYL